MFGVLVNICLLIAAMLVSILLFCCAFVGSVIALWGCAICDNSPPNYIAPVLLFGAYGLIQSLIIRFIRAGWSSSGYRL